MTKHDKPPLTGRKNLRCFGFLFVSYGDISTNFKTAKQHLSIPIYVYWATYKKYVKELTILYRTKTANLMIQGPFIGPQANFF